LRLRVEFEEGSRGERGGDGRREEAMRGEERRGGRRMKRKEAAAEDGIAPASSAAKSLPPARGLG
jgi:hypothetical protein